jgi:two-component system OmpR family sensor kinase/two-component system phosphate regulon sensor histidine kinase PhoR
MINIKAIKWKFFIYYFLLFAVFTLSMVIFENKREYHFRVAQLAGVLNEYTDLTNRYIQKKAIASNKNFAGLDSLKIIIPPEKVRITVIDFSGKVLYDNSVADLSHLENHKSRPEVEKALYGGNGENIRLSATTKEEYFYYAKSYPSYIIRAALPFNNEIRHFLKADKYILPFFIFLFIVFGIILAFITTRIGNTITKLKDFVLRIRRNEAIIPSKFPRDELGVISHEIVELYEEFRKAKIELTVEKDKLINHLFVLKEGVAFFSADKKIILNNSHFIFYLNIISGDTSIEADKIFHIQELRDLNDFINKNLEDRKSFHTMELPRKEYRIERDGYHFLIQCIFFSDRSFEILITDNTALMKRSIMKQQLTSNIAHELKTPIASVKGYLETILNNPAIDASKIQYFIEKAYNQSERLTQLVNDIAMLNKIEESSELYPPEKVDIKKVITEVIENFSDQLQRKQIKVELSIQENTIVQANYSLVFTIFRNLMDNSVNYGGEQISIWINQYHEDRIYYYFSFYDNGPGVEEEHLIRIFERFYRIDSGRSRKVGGTGLGLAIVKNAILSFKGEISARKCKGGGVEFLFSLPKG